MSVYRPGGVTTLAILFIIIAALGVIGAIGVEVIIVAARQTVINNELYGVLGVLFLPFLPFPFTMVVLLSALYDISSSLSYIGYLHLATIIILLVVVFYVIAAVGLLRMKNWGRYLALIIGIFDMVIGIIGITVIVGIIILIFGIVIVAYLTGDVKYEFE